MKWICCQIGGREHYAIPRALHQRGVLDLMVTDTWVPPGNFLGSFKGNLRERFHRDLSTAVVHSANLGSIWFELRAKLFRLRGWPQMIARNEWFQKIAVKKLRSVELGQPRTLFVYSYAAHDILRFARSRGWRTVLGQIDAGPPEERIVARLYRSDPVQHASWEPTPQGYWESWREECALADRVVVNSAWSQQALEEEGIPAEKLRVVPLLYATPKEAEEFKRKYPETFSAMRPLRVLFLGQVNLRKGIGPLLEAIRLLRDDPVEFWIVGSVQIQVPLDLRANPRIHWVGAVPQSTTAAFYRSADVFLFPTFSDGFGLTQLEAQVWKLPVIASKFCGDVVKDGHNGWLLAELSATEMAAAVRRCLARPSQLRELAANAVPSERFSLERGSETLLEIFE
jgi:glycosyltransferase involved in cell wall biosynthesis